MPEQLSKIENCSIDELQSIGQNVQRYINIEDDATLQMALEKINRKPNLLQRLFPDKFQKMQQEMTINRLQNVHKAKEQMFAIYTGVQLEIARQQGDALISAVGMELKDRLTKFAETKISSMAETLEKSRTEYMERMHRQRINVEKYRDIPDLAEQYEQSLKDETQIYFSFIKELLDGFKETLTRKSQELSK
jgi:hypothetical protein